MREREKEVKEEETSEFKPTTNKTKKVQDMVIGQAMRILFKSMFCHTARKSVGVHVYSTKYL